MQLKLQSKILITLVLSVIFFITTSALLKAKPGDAHIQYTFVNSSGSIVTWVYIEGQNGTLSPYTIKDGKKIKGWVSLLPEDNDDYGEESPLEPTDLIPEVLLADISVVQTGDVLTVTTDKQIYAQLVNLQTGALIGDFISVLDSHTFNTMALPMGCVYAIVLYQEVEGYYPYMHPTFTFCKASNPNN